jgi:peptide/nickel transport system substrate-binding protein
MTFIDRKTKLKARRLIRKQKRIAESVSEQADQDLNRLFFRRIGRLQNVRRFIFVWITLVLMLGLGALWQVRALDKYYLETAPVAGGVYREGIIGSFTNSNPLFATGAVDTSIAELIYSGLFKISPEGDVVGDLASKYDVDERGITYTVTLRDDVFWHDGEKFDANDVVFTYKTIQNPAALSALRSNWSGVTVASTDDKTVVFTLPNALGSFPYSLTNGIIPEHILKDIQPVNLRSNKFNTVTPVGTGQFRFKTLEVSGDSKETRQERIALSKNNNYFGQKPGLESVVIQTYSEEDRMIDDFNDKIIQSMVGLTSVSDNLKLQEDVELQQATLTSSVMIFFNNSTELLKDKKLRQALIHATNTQSLREGLGYNPLSANSPLLKNQFAYNSDIVQLPYDLERAKVLLDEAGWTLNAGGIRAKGETILKFRLVSQSLSEYASISQKLQKDWSDIGIQVEAILQPEEEIQTGALTRHDYDILLYGISIGFDPDVFAYWHSSQNNPNSANLNLSEFNNSIADKSLEAGRTRVDEDLRKIKYEPFLRQWQDEAPAIALYQPRFVMVTRGTFEGFSGGFMISATDRFWSIADWKVRNTDVIKQ